MFVSKYVALPSLLYVDVLYEFAVRGTLKTEERFNCKTYFRMGPGTLKASNHAWGLPTCLRRFWLWLYFMLRSSSHSSAARHGHVCPMRMLNVLRARSLFRISKCSRWGLGVFLACWNLAQHRGRKLPVDGTSARNHHDNGLIFFLVAVRPAVHTVTEWTGWWPGEGEQDRISLAGSLPLSTICRPRERLWLD